NRSVSSFISVKFGILMDCKRCFIVQTFFRIWIVSWQIYSWVLARKTQNILHGVNCLMWVGADAIRDFLEQVFFGITCITCQKMKIVYIIHGGNHRNMRGCMSPC